MKKNLFIVLGTIFAVGGALLVGTNSNSFKAAEAAEVDNKVLISDYVYDGSWNPYGWGTHGVTTSGLTDTVAADNEGSMWGNHMLNFSLRDSMEFTFKFNCYDNTEDNCGRNTDGLDIYICNSECTERLGLFRIWSKAWGAHNGNHSCIYYDLVGGGWSKSTSTFIDVGGAECSVVSGDATSTSSFTIRISRTMGLEFINVWGNYSYIGDTEIRNSITNTLKNSSTFGLIIGADGAFARETVVTLAAYEGQSFANDGTYFVDTTGPATMSSASFDKSVLIYDNEVPTLSVNSDLFGGTTTTELYYDNVKVEDVSKFELHDLGNHVLTVRAIDARGNFSDVNFKRTVNRYTADTFNAYVLDPTVLSQACATHYENAKKRATTMEETEVTAFTTLGQYDAARARYENWCKANYDPEPYSGDPVKGAVNMELLALNLNKNFNYIYLSIILIVPVGAAIVLLIKKKKKQHN